MTEALLIFLFSTFILITAAIVVYIYSAITQKDIVSKERLRAYKDKLIHSPKVRYGFYGLVVITLLLILYYIINSFFAQRINQAEQISVPAPVLIPAETFRMHGFVESATLIIALFLILLAPIIIYFSNFRTPLFKLFLPEVTLVIALLTTPLYSIIMSGIGSIGFFSVLFAPIWVLLFPTGLLILITQIFGEIEYDNNNFISVIWVIYFFIMLISKFIKNQLWYIFLYSIFVILLSVNIVGCNIDLSNIK